MICGSPKGTMIIFLHKFCFTIDQNAKKGRGVFVNAMQQQPASSPHSALRQDIRLLGRTLGEVIHESDGKAIYETIEKVRRAAVSFRREGDDAQRTILERAIRRLDNDQVNLDRKSTRLNSSHVKISYAVFCLKKKKTTDAAVREQPRS